ncbi:MAG: hypothetical protein Q8P69_00005 [bacterium]|nr:hypothetical protein [bacterium]
MSDEKLSLTGQENNEWGFFVASQEREMPIFRSFARYRKDLDQIVVQSRKCNSVTKIKIGEMLTLVEDNDSEVEEDVPAGFVIDRACVYCTQQALLVKGWVNLHEVLDSFLHEPYYYTESDIAVAHDILNQVRISRLEIA